MQAQEERDEEIIAEIVDHWEDEDWMPEGYIGSGDGSSQ